MKKTILTALILSSISAFSQKSSITLGFGFATPSGEFAANDVNSSSPKFYAKSGGLLELGYTYNLNDNWGLSLDYRFIANPRDISPIVNEIKKTTTVISSTNGNYTGAGFFVGGFYKIPFGKMKLHLNGSFGSIGFASNEFSVFTTNQTLTKKQYITNTLAVDLGAKITYQLFKSEKFFGYFKVDYLIANPKIENEETTNVTGSNTTTSKNSYDFVYNNLNFCFGIGYNFIKK